MAFVQIKPGAMLAPLPVVLISSGAKMRDKTVQNVMTAAWAGTVCTHPLMFSVSIRPQRWTYQLVETSGEFVINLTTEALLKATDYCGVVSGKNTDKWRNAGLTPMAAEAMAFAPAVAESPLYIACKVRQSLALGSHTIFIGEAAAMGVEASLIDQRGAICLERAKLITYSHGQYAGLKESTGFFGFSVASKAALKRRTQGK